MATVAEAAKTKARSGRQIPVPCSLATWSTNTPVITPLMYELHFWSSLDAGGDMVQDFNIAAALGDCACANEVATVKAATMLMAYLALISPSAPSGRTGGPRRCETKPREARRREP
jgi:hypothetical protein